MLSKTMHETHNLVDYGHEQNKNVIKMTIKNNKVKDGNDSEFVDYIYELLEDIPDSQGKEIWIKTIFENCKTMKDFVKFNIESAILQNLPQAIQDAVFEDLVFKHGSQEVCEK